MPSLHGLSVLIVDDEPDALEVMAAALQACGASVVSASSARDALQTLERDEVDLLLSDIAMPGRRRLRAHPDDPGHALVSARDAPRGGRDCTRA